MQLMIRQRVFDQMSKVPIRVIFAKVKEIKVGTMGTTIERINMCEMGTTIMTTTSVGITMATGIIGFHHIPLKIWNFPLGKVEVVWRD